MSRLDSPPLAPQRETLHSHHGHTIRDPFQWLQEPSEETLAYLASENEWTEQQTAHLAPLRDTIYAEIAARTKQTDTELPTFVTHTDGTSWWYFTRTRAGKQYRHYGRIEASGRSELPDLDANDDTYVFLDANDLAEGEEFFSLGALEISPDGSTIAYTVDVTGDEVYDLYLRNLASGTATLAAKQVGQDLAWAGNEHLFFLRVDSAWRPHEVWRLSLASGQETLVVTEADEKFWLYVDTSRDYSCVLIASSSKTTSEYQLIDCTDPTKAPRVVRTRTPGLEYHVEPAGEQLIIWHNAGNPEFDLAVARLDRPDSWTPIAGCDADDRLLAVDAYRDFLVCQTRHGGLPAIGVIPRKPSGGFGAPRRVKFAGQVYDVAAAGEANYDTDSFRIHFQTQAVPETIYDYRVPSDELVELWQQPVLALPSGKAFDSADYVEQRIWARSRTGCCIPVSIVRAANSTGPAPLLLYGYGSYEFSTPTRFSIPRLSLLDRGVTFAIAHVRGGGECGRSWYEHGRLNRKLNTFTDFIDVAEHLIEAGYTTETQMAAWGGSAGGLLMGAVANLAPDTFCAIHAAVPFVDTLTTMLNPEMPLTVTEWDEWGDPLHDQGAYDYLLAYSPYHNLTEQDYPAILATTSLNDTRVSYAEPAKWVAQLRRMSPETEVLLQTEMVAGHGGVSGRYRAWRQIAFEYAWLLSKIIPSLDSPK